MGPSSSPDHGPVLVTGATGPHGRSVVEALLAAGRRVRALTRNPDGSLAQQLGVLGAELAQGDLLDRESLLDAMTGAIAVYAVTTPFSAGPEGELRQGEQLIAAARDTEVPWLILASVASADRATGIPHSRASGGSSSSFRLRQCRIRSSRPPTSTKTSPTPPGLSRPAS